MKENRRLGYLLLSTLLMIGPNIARGDVIVASVVETQLANSTFQYTYTLVNNSDTSITEFDVGNNFLGGNAELLVPPVGWTLGGGFQSGTVASPSNWDPQLITTEGSPTFYIAWSILQDSASLQPGNSLSGFSVILPSEDQAYLEGHFTAILSDASAVSGLLQVNTSTVPEPSTVVLVGVGLVIVAGRSLLSRYSAPKKGLG